MLNSRKHLGTAAGLCLLAAGCTSQNQVAQTHKGSYSSARHHVLGSNIPAPDRGIDGASDSGDSDVSREQFQQMQSRQSSIGGGVGGGVGGGR